MNGENVATLTGFVLLTAMVFVSGFLFGCGFWIANLLIVGAP